jgi:hypothetical protein
MGKPLIQKKVKLADNVSSAGFYMRVARYVSCLSAVADNLEGNEYNFLKAQSSVCLLHIY